MISLLKNALIGFLMLPFCWLGTGAQAQNLLEQPVQYNPERQETLVHALYRLSETHGFYFSYQDTIISTEELVSISHYRGSLSGFLDQLLGDEYEFKEL